MNSLPLAKMLEKNPVLEDFFLTYRLPEPEAAMSPEEFFAAIPESVLVENGTDRAMLLNHWQLFLSQVDEFAVSHGNLSSLEILGGLDKGEHDEPVRRLLLKPGDVLSVVGPTGAGKSQLLEDIECLAQGDTPSRRRILVNGAEPDDSLRFSVDRRLVAQLSQNMNFVMDLCVADFLNMHAESRMIENPHLLVEEIFETAIGLAGEPFTMNTPVTDLSGGQSRALMIADVACLSSSPVVLIDEIENAGVDRDKALKLLIRSEKLVLIVTHDPTLALMAPRRLVIADGGMSVLVERTESELYLLEELRTQAAKLYDIRRRLRSGESF